MAVPNEEMLAIVRGLPIPVPWDLDVFIEAIAAQRGRPIHLIPTDTAGLGDSPCGLWLSRDHDDLILHERGTSAYHIRQIVCHEVGHMMLGHGRTRSFGPVRDREVEVCQAAMPDLDPEAVNAVLGRTDFANDQERDAEAFASILMIAAAEAANQRSMMRSVFFRSK